MYFSICQILVLCVLIGKVCCWNNVQGCKVDVVNNTQKGMPLLFYIYTAHFKLAMPKRGEINLNAGDRIILACTGKRNYLTANSAKIWDRPGGFSTEGLGPEISASVAYTQAFQKSTFNSLLSSARLASYYINSNSYLARGHLAPTADFILAASKRTTFYYINTIPQWQIINGGNWKSMEIRIRKTAEAYNRTFNISTGTYGVLTLPDINRDLKPIYLVSRNKLPVPRDIWKIVYDPETQMGIANIVMNNPFLERVSEEDLLCDNICEQNGWGTINWSNFSRGFTYCCDLIQFQKAVGIVHHPTVRGILRGTNSP